MIKAIFFDFDGVLTTDSSGSDTICRNISNGSGVPFETVRESYNNHVADLVLGRKRYADIWDEFCKGLGKQVDVGILKDVYANIPLNTKMFEVVRELHAHYMLGIITDNLRDRLDTLVEQYQLGDLFSHNICSADIGSGKHNQEIFKAALDQSGFKPEESIFIDNKEKNLVVPKEMGFHTYYHDDAKNDVQAFKIWLAEQGIAI